MTIALRRPLLTMFTLGCGASLMTSGRVTLRLLIPCMLYAAIVPLCEIGSLTLVMRRRSIPFSRAVDLYLKSDQFWLLWIVGYAAMWAFVPARLILSSPASKLIWAGAAVIVMAITAVLDFRFFRSVLKRSPARAALDLTVQRLLCWTAALLLFVPGAGLETVEAWLGL